MRSVIASATSGRLSNASASSNSLVSSSSSLSRSSRISLGGKEGEVPMWQLKALWNSITSEYQSWFIFSFLFLSNGSYSLG